jgi:MFS family permease
VFFPAASPSSQALNAFLTFGIAFLAPPLGSAVFGHFGDRVGRKATLVASLLVMGISTTLIGLLPGYDTLGTAAAALLCLLRFGQGIGLGGEWGGAALLATESAPAGRKAWFGMFPQLGTPIGFLLANGLFLLLLSILSNEQFKSWGWRLPFLASAVLVLIGLYVRMSLEETPAFARAMTTNRPVPIPLATLIRGYWRPLLQGLVVDRRLLHLVLHFDSVCVELRRLNAAYFEGVLFAPSLHCNFVHGAGNAAFGLARRRVRPACGAACRICNSRSVRLPVAESAPQRKHNRGSGIPRLGSVPDGVHLRPSGRSATRAVPDARALYRSCGRL